MPAEAPTIESPAPAQQTSFDIAFPQIPIVDDPSPPDSANETLLSDLADFGQDSAPEAGPPAFVLSGEKDILFDFQVGEPVGVANGSGTWITDEISILQWAQKAVMTPKGKYAIYPPGYGSEMDKIRGVAMADPTLHSEIARTVKECMLFHPRILDVAIWSIRREPRIGRGALLITLQLTLDTTEDPVNLVLRV